MSWRTEMAVNFRLCPRRSFSLFSHQSMPPSVMNYLFNEKTQVFAQLTDAELRVLKKYLRLWRLRAGDSRSPESPAAESRKRCPRHARFQMNLRRLSHHQRGRKDPVQRARRFSRGPESAAGRAARRRLRCYAMKLCVGVLSESEIIASVVWEDGKARIAGLR